MAESNAGCKVWGRVMVVSGPLSLSIACVLCVGTNILGTSWARALSEFFLIWGFLGPLFVNVCYHSCSRTDKALNELSSLV